MRVRYSTTRGARRAAQRVWGEAWPTHIGKDGRTVSLPPGEAAKARARQKGAATRTGAVYYENKGRSEVLAPAEVATRKKLSAAATSVKRVSDLSLSKRLALWRGYVGTSGTWGAAVDATLAAAKKQGLKGIDLERFEVTIRVENEDFVFPFGQPKGSQAQRRSSWAARGYRKVIEAMLKKLKGAPGAFEVVEVVTHRQGKSDLFSAELVAIMHGSEEIEKGPADSEYDDPASDLPQTLGETSVPVFVEISIKRKF